MPIDRIGKPNVGGGQMKTGYKLMGRTVPRGSGPQRPSRQGPIATNHPITSVRKALSGSGKKAKSMY